MLFSSRFLCAAALLSAVCCAQAPGPALNRRIANQIRSTYSARPDVNITLGERKPSEFTGFDQLPVIITGTGGNVSTLKMLISQDNKTLMRFEKIAIDEDPMKRIDLQGRPVRGQKDAAVTMVNYDDFQCPFCSRMHQTLFPGILKEYGDRVRIIYKDFPLFEIHPWALHAAIDANCLGTQNNDAYWSFADYVHANQREINGEKILAKEIAALDRIATGEGKKRALDAKSLGACISAQSDKAVRASAAEGTQLGVDSTPTLFVNGEKISGALPEEEVRTVIDRALRDAGQKPPLHKAAPTPRATPRENCAPAPPPAPARRTTPES